jgi:hypothetical protein
MSVGRMNDSNNIELYSAWVGMGGSGMLILILVEPKPS